MKKLLAAGLLMGVANAFGASAPFVQLTGTASNLSNTCTGSNVVPNFAVNADVPAGRSYSYDLAYFTQPSYETDEDAGMVYVEPMETLLYESKPQNGPVAGSNARFVTVPVSTWFALISSVIGISEMSLTITTYMGPNGTGAIASMTTTHWICGSGNLLMTTSVDNANGAIPASLAKTAAVEFYHAQLDHYFVTNAAAEIASLDSGATAGWARTGKAFNVFAAGATGSSPVCRFYIPPGKGDSHFYSASAAECAAVQAQYPTFSYESPSVFYIAAPDTTTGACPPLTEPVYRLWNNRADSNHRYTNDPAIKAQMIARGYVAEGYGPDAVIMCAPL